MTEVAVVDGLFRTCSSSANKDAIARNDSNQRDSPLSAGLISQFFARKNATNASAAGSA